MENEKKNPKTSPITQKISLSGLARRLINAGLIEEEEALKALSESIKQKTSFITYLLEKELMENRPLAMMLSKTLGIPLLDITALDIENIPKDLIRSELIQKHNALPIFKRGQHLFVAISDPTNIESMDEFKFHLGMQIDPILVEHNKLLEITKRASSSQEMAALQSLEMDESLESLDSLDILSEEDQVEEAYSDVMVASQEDKPIVRFVNKIILDAINLGASDIHFEPYEGFYRVRFRQDGILYEHNQPPNTLSARISTRLKVMAQLDISERRIPQDGRFRMRLSKHRYIDFRVNSCPTLYGEKIVLRILDPTSAQIGIEKLGFEPEQETIFLKHIKKPQGMVLVTGPTGSGKTVSLYTALNILNQSTLNISTCEDPVEINLPGINQVQINVKAGLEFASALKAFLRQDPDIIMVGEIRDLETADIAVKAAQTGHMVLSTLHTNNCADTLTRLIHMGVPAYNLATSVSLVIAQRLARKLCQHCKTPMSVPEKALLEIGFQKTELLDLQLYSAKGCQNCTQGYKGRIGFFEILPISAKISELIMAGANAIAIAQASREEGFWTLRESGLDKVKQGITSLEEINRVTKE